MRLAPGWRPWVLIPLALSLGFLTLAVQQAWALAAALVLLGLAGFNAFFFRDPDRAPGSGIVSACDGRVHTLGEASLATFLNVHNVHVIRAPYAGTVQAVERFSGGHRPAFLAGAKRNAGVAITLDTRWGELTVDLIAGLIARRAVSWVVPGQEIEKGQRIGLIKFGSRVDVELPQAATVEVAPGQPVRAGETTIAMLEAEAP